VSEWLLFNTKWAIFQLHLYIMARTSYISTLVILVSEWLLWRTKWTIFKLHLLGVSGLLLHYICISWREQVTFRVSEWLLFTTKWTIAQLHLYIMARTSYISKEWVIVVYHQVNNCSATFVYHGKNKLHFEWVSDCCLPPSEQLLSYICISWQEQVTFLKSEWLLFNAKWAISKLYHCKNEQHVNKMMLMSALC
jgi:hypothetical protein